MGSSCSTGNENLFFRDAKLKKYFDRNAARDLGKFRKRMRDTYGSKSFEKFVYVFVTDACRDIILNTVGEISEHMKTMGDLVVSGGEAFNMYMPYNDRIVTSDIDAKFVPRIAYDAKYFGKLQAVKLILWDKLGQIAQKLNQRVKTRIMSMDKKIIKFSYNPEEILSKWKTTWNLTLHLVLLQAVCKGYCDHIQHS